MFPGKPDHRPPTVIISVTTVLAAHIVPASTTHLSEHKDPDQPSKTGPSTGPLHFDPGFIALGVNVDRGSAIRESRDRIMAHGSSQHNNFFFKRIVL